MATRDEVELIKGHLTATVVSREIRECDRVMPCWTVMSHGLETVGQRELALTILRQREAGLSAPPGALSYLMLVHSLARQGRHVEAGGLSSWQAPGPLGIADFVGVAFVEPQSIPGVEPSREALAGVFLKPGEVEMATRCSVPRVLNALGRQVRYYPCPYWSDPERPPVYVLGDAEHSVLSKLPRVRLLKTVASVNPAADTCHLCLPRPEALKLAEGLRSRGGVAVLLDHNSSAAGRLVWFRGQSRPEAIHLEGSQPASVEAAFVAFIKGGDASDSVAALEDGFLARLSNQTEAALFEALERGRSVEILCGDTRRLLTVTVSGQ